MMNGNLALQLDDEDMPMCFVEQTREKRPIRIIDLFAGLGGIRLGFTQGAKRYGFDVHCVFSSEIKPYAVKTYKNYFGDENVFGDITSIKTQDIPDFDFLLAGFPCQPFSSAGKGMGFSDTRGTLFFEIERILREKKEEKSPAKGFLLENVEGLVNHNHGITLNVILSHLKALGYCVNYRVIDSQYFGLAQSRKRVYIVGMLDESIKLTDFDRKYSVLGDILEQGLPTIDTTFTRQLFSHFAVDEIVGKSIKDKRGGAQNIHSWDIELKGKTSPIQRRLLSTMLKERRKKKWADVIGIKWMDGMPLTEAQIRTFFDVPNLKKILDDLVKKGYLVYEYPKELKNGKRIYALDKEKGYNIVAGKLSFEFSKILDPKKLAPTLVATDVGRLGVVDGNGLRRLTIREAQRLCGYPESYDLSMIKENEAFDLLGNTVCVPVIAEISKRMVHSWSEFYGEING